ncbi:hypothetical protein AB5N19_14467 [Seiridium cardinale]
MRRFLSSAVVAVLLQSIQLVSATNANTNEVCITKRASTSKKGCLSTTKLVSTTTLDQTVVITSTPVVTFTPDAVIVTSTITTTETTESDVPQSTDVFTLTETDSVTTTITLDEQTVTATADEAVTETVSTTVVGTTTVATPSGFLPVQSTLPNSAAKRKRNAARRGTLDQLTSGASALLPDCREDAPSDYPAEVTCVSIVESYTSITVTATASSSVTITASATTETTTTTSTVTSTTVLTTPDASSTVVVTVTSTDEATSTPVTTVTVTATTTVSASVYTSTAYAICQDSANYADSYNGVGFQTTYSPNGDITAVTTNDSNQEDCCSSCAATANCAGTAYYGGFPAGSQCYLLTTVSNTCSVGGTPIGATYSSSLSAGSGYHLSNGNCGAVDVAMGS